MKTLYTFIENKEQEVEEVESSVNENGETVSITKKVKKQVPIKFGLRTPSRTMRDDADLFYGVKYSEAVKAGFLTNDMVNKHIANDGGILSAQQIKEQEITNKEFANKLSDYEKLSIQEKTEENKEKEKIIEGELFELRKKLQAFELQRMSAYDNTAETYAGNKTSTWWFLHLAIKENGQDFFPLFTEKTHEERLQKWYEVDESEDYFLRRVMQKLLMLVSFYYTGKVSTKEDFDTLIKLIDDKST